MSIGAARGFGAHLGGVEIVSVEVFGIEKEELLAKRQLAIVPLDPFPPSYSYSENNPIQGKDLDGQYCMHRGSVRSSVPLKKVAGGVR